MQTKKTNTHYENWELAAIERSKQERKKKHKQHNVKGVFMFILHFIILCVLLAAIVVINAYGNDFKQTLLKFIKSSNGIFLLVSMFILFITIYMYYKMVNNAFLRSPKNITLMFSILFSSLIICYTFSRFSMIYARPCMLLGLLAVVLLNKREAVFLNIIFALMLFCVDNFTNMPTNLLTDAFTTDNSTVMLLIKAKRIY